MTITNGMFSVCSAWKVCLPHREEGMANLGSKKATKAFWTKYWMTWMRISHSLCFPTRLTTHIVQDRRKFSRGGDAAFRKRWTLHCRWLTTSWNWGAWKNSGRICTMVVYLTWSSLVSAQIRLSSLCVQCHSNSSTQGDRQGNTKRNTQACRVLGSPFTKWIWRNSRCIRKYHVVCIVAQVSERKYFFWFISGGWHVYRIAYAEVKSGISLMPKAKRHPRLEPSCKISKCLVLWKSTQKCQVRQTHSSQDKGTRRSRPLVEIDVK